ncbi:MAG: carbamoyltransferase N-terminal domain-containing protein, partial [Pseudomonadota bacterium]
MSAGYTLGISSYFHDSAAALLHGSDVIAAAQEERFTRKKADASFPQNAIAYCLSLLPAGTAPDQVAYFESPALKADRIVRNAAAQAPRGASIWPQTRRTLRQLAEDLPDALTALSDDPRRIHFVPHHRSHAASAFYPAPFTEAAVLVADGVGEWSTTTLWTGRGTALDPVGEIRFPHSLGLFYSAVTQYCGFKVNSGEYKLMGLAPFGLPEFRAKMQDMLIDVKADGSFALDMAYFDFATGFSTTSPLFADLFGRPDRHPNDPIDQFYMNMAASAQSVLEDVMVRLSTTLLERTGQRNLCLAGGVALNCVANRALLRDVPGLDALWVQPAAGDAGGALGAALDVAHRNAPTKAKRSFDVLLGPGFDDAEIAEALDAADLVYERPGALAETTAEALAAGQIIGHFDGRMEFGPRALGNRSILADPRSTDALSRVNKSIKFREDWRPFAPMVLAAHAATYFEPPVESPHMLL